MTTILYAVGDRVLFKPYRRQLEKAGHCVVAVERPLAVLTVGLRSQWDVVVVDGSPLGRGVLTVLDGLEARPKPVVGIGVKDRRVTRSLAAPVGASELTAALDELLATEVERLVLRPEKIETPIITENAQVIAQLVSGGIYAHYTPVPPDSVVQIKKDQPKINLYKTDIANVGISIFFGFKAGNGAPFKDERMRQAFSMSLDRDLYLDTWANISKFKADGLEVETKWNTAARPSDYSGWFLDPQGKDFGENAKYYQYNIAEAKKLLAAAGFPNGVSMDSHEAAGTNYGLNYASQIEVVNGMAAEAGFKFTRQQYQAPAPWNADYRDSRGFFDGIAYRLTPVPAEPGEGLFALYNKDGSLNYGFDAEGKGLTSAQGPFLGDPTCDDLTKKMRSEFDNAKRIQYAHDLQRYVGRKQYFFHALGSATGFNVAWPAVQNFAVFNGLQWGYLLKRYWLDNTKAPFA